MSAESSPVSQPDLPVVLLPLPVFTGPGKNENAEKVAEKLEALSVKEARDEAEDKSEEKQ